jgi:dipeptidyl aminopeptidase/acylaminoacyl peptidase
MNLDDGFASYSFNAALVLPWLVSNVIEREITDEMINNGEVEKILESISPMSYVNSNTPPSIFAYGGKDTLVLPENGEELKNRFDEAGVKYDYVFFPDSDHALIHNFGKRIVYAGIVIDYCREYFK